MKIVKIFPILIVLFGFSSLTVYSQDNEATEIKDKMKIKTGEKADFVFTRAFLPGQTADSAYLQLPRSGIYSFGFAYGIASSKTFEFKLEPRVTWMKLVFQQTDFKWFPTDSTADTTIYEKSRFCYLELPVGFKIKLGRNAAKKYKFLFEAGFSSGLNIASISKRKVRTDLNQDGNIESRLTTKVHHVANVNLLRYGPYARLGTNWGSLYIMYRMTDIYNRDRKYQKPDGSFVSYPKFSRIEAGASLTF